MSDSIKHTHGNSYGYKGSTHVGQYPNLRCHVYSNIGERVKARMMMWAGLGLGEDRLEVKLGCRILHLIRSFVVVNED